MLNNNKVMLNIHSREKVRFLFKLPLGKFIFICIYAARGIRMFVWPAEKCHKVANVMAIYKRGKSKYNNIIHIMCLSFL